MKDDILGNVLSLKGVYKIENLKEFKKILPKLPW